MSLTPDNNQQEERRTADRRIADRRIADRRVADRRTADRRIADRRIGDRRMEEALLSSSMNFPIGGINPPGRFVPPGNFNPPGNPAGPMNRPGSPPPSRIPARSAQQISRAVDSGSIRMCMFRFTYVWLRNGAAFWLYPVFVGPRSVGGFRWGSRGWAYTGINLNLIDFFECV